MLLSKYNPLEDAMSRFKHLFYLLSITVFIVSPSMAETIDLTITTYTVEKPLGPTDLRGEYDRNLLELALKKTEATYGAFAFNRAPAMNQVRAIETIRNDTYRNFVRVLGYDKKLEEKGLRYIDFPIFLGLLGYRTCFYSHTIKERLPQNISSKGLKQFLFGVGRGWIDDKILRHNGFRTTIAINYETMFELTARGRIELFCRGANEVLDEFTTHHTLEGLHYDRSFYLHYPMRHFYYFSKNQEKDMKRVKEGLDIALRDGSLMELWKRYHAKNLDFLKLETRKRISLENPVLAGKSFHYQDILFSP